MIARGARLYWDELGHCGMHQDVLAGAGMLWDTQHSAQLLGRGSQQAK